MMTGNDGPLLTTGRAAELLGVTPDTVLRWVRKGRLAAHQTAGGHCRIRLEDLKPLLGPEMPVPASAPPECGARPLFCWEYLNPRGGIPEECRSCIVYQARVTWCFRLAQLDQEMGHRGTFCLASCEECAYFRRVHRLATNVLVISSDPKLVSKLAAEPSSSLALRFARNPYCASAMIQDFRAGFVIVDEDLWRHESELVDCLASDPRAPGLRIILAVRKASKRPTRQRPENVVAVLEKPFGLDRVEHVIRAIPVEALPGADETRNENCRKGGKDAG
jgi:excisionase family DNA binding protein